jgi:FSR family fosmidomycin resistance protein-like MFS transporter
MDRRAIVTLTVSHAVVDFCQGVLPALLPFFMIAHHLDYAALGSLMLAATAGSAVVQPLFGLFADRIAAPWLLPAAVLATGGGLALAGVAPVYALIFAAVALSGLGVAGFHPEAARLVNFAAGDRRATGMSLFSLGGSVGFAAAPLVAVRVAEAGGLATALLVLLAPAAAVGVYLVGQLRRLGRLHPSARPGAAHGRPAPANDWGAFGVLSLAVICRSVVFFGVTAFLPLYWVKVLDRSEVAGGTALGVLMGCGIAGTLLGGWLADRAGRRLVLRLSFALLPVLLLGLMSVPLAGAVALLAPLGLIMLAPGSVLVVMGQEFLPNRVGFASGVTIGLAVSAGGLMAPLLGGAADLYGLPTVFAILAGVAALAAVLALALPRRVATA